MKNNKMGSILERNLDRLTYTKNPQNPSSFKIVPMELSTLLPRKGKSQGKALIPILSLQIIVHFQDLSTNSSRTEATSATTLQYGPGKEGITQVFPLFEISGHF